MFSIFSKQGSLVSRMLTSVILTLVAGGGGWLFLNSDEIHQLSDVVNLLSEQVGSAFETNETTKPKMTPSDSIKIASFNIQTFGRKKSQQSDVMETLKSIVTQFDLVAVQEIRAKDNPVIKNFVDKINADGHQFGFTVGTRVGRTSHQEQYAFIYNQEKLVLDRVHSYTVSDPDDLFHREPLVGWFRTLVGEQAFTFSIINLHLDARHPEKEIVFLDDLFRAVRKDGRGEDDVIVAGDFNANERELGKLRRYGLVGTMGEFKTNTRGTKQYDNLLINRLATSEYTGNSGVFDFLQFHNLSMTEALRVSDHLPVWAEFSVFEDVLR